MVKDNTGKRKYCLQSPKNGRNWHDKRMLVSSLQKTHKGMHVHMKGELQR
jgi:hypothetical protein